MYKINNKFSSILGFIIIFILVICNGCNTKQTVVTSKSNTTDVYAEKQLKEETLTFYFQGYEPQGVRKVQDEIEKRLKPTLNVKLNFKWIQKDAYLKQVSYSLEEVNPPDVFIISKDDMLEFVKSGKVADITPYFEKSTPKLYQMYNKEDLANVSINNKLFAIPQFLTGSSRICAVIREDVLKKFHVTDIKNYEDLEKLFSAIRQDGYHGPVVIQKTPLELFGAFSGYVPVSDNLVYQADDANMKLVPWEQTPDFRIAIETLERWKKSGYVMNYNLAESMRDFYWSMPALGNFAFADSAATILTDWDDIQNYLYFQGAQDPKVKVFPLYPDKIVPKPSNINMIAISKQAKDPERILKFIEWIEGSQENYDLFMYGIKGQNYELKDTKVEFPLTVQKYYGWDGSEVFFNTKYLHFQASDTDVLKADEKTVYAKVTGFTPDTSVIQTFLETRKENYRKLQNRIENDYINVDKNIPAFISEQQSAGIDRITEELQKQLDQWKNDDIK